MPALPIVALTGWRLLVSVSDSALGLVGGWGSYDCTLFPRPQDSKPERTFTKRMTLLLRSLRLGQEQRTNVEV